MRYHAESSINSLLYHHFIFLKNQFYLAHTTFLFQELILTFKISFQIGFSASHRSNAPSTPVYFYPVLLLSLLYRFAYFLSLYFFTNTHRHNRPTHNLGTDPNRTSQAPNSFTCFSLRVHNEHRFCKFSINDSSSSLSIDASIAIVGALLATELRVFIFPNFP